MPDTVLGSPFPQGSAVTGTEQVAGGGPNSVYTSAVGYFGPTGPNNNPNMGYAAAPTTGTTMMGPAIQVIWSKEILFQAMPVLRFRAVRGEEDGTRRDAGSDRELHALQQPADPERPTD